MIETACHRLDWRIGFVEWDWILKKSPTHGRDQTIGTCLLVLVVVVVAALFKHDIHTGAFFGG